MFVDRLKGLVQGEAMDDVMDNDAVWAGVLCARGRWEAAIACTPEAQMLSPGFCGD